MTTQSTATDHADRRLVVALPGPYDQVREHYETLVPEADLGRFSRAASWQATVELAKVNALHGFMRYYRGDITAVMAGSPSSWKATQYLMGNHTIAERMFRHDPSVMLHAPLRTQLRAAPPAGPGGAVVHGDFRLDNCIMARQMPPSVAAVLDWELATLGDPLADLGLLLFYWRQNDEAKPVLTPAPSMLPGFPPRSYLADRYALRTGADLSDLTAYVALAHFKFAVIAQGIAARVRAGSMAGQEFGDLDAEVERIAGEGLAVLGNRPVITSRRANDQHRPAVLRIHGIPARSVRGRA